MRRGSFVGLQNLHLDRLHRAWEVRSCRLNMLSLRFTLVRD
jgi:hypothetical protein